MSLRELGFGLVAAVADDPRVGAVTFPVDLVSSLSAGVVAMLGYRGFA